MTDRNGNTWQEAHPLPQDVVNETFECTMQVYGQRDASGALRILSGRVSYVDLLSDASEAEGV